VLEPGQRGLQLIVRAGSGDPAQLEMGRPQLFDRPPRSEAERPSGGQCGRRRGSPAVIVREHLVGHQRQPARGAQRGKLGELGGARHLAGRVVGRDHHHGAGALAELDLDPIGIEREGGRGPSR
jgi:hypothetical protein